MTITLLLHHFTFTDNNFVEINLSDHLTYLNSYITQELNLDNDQLKYSKIYWNKK
ncbi:hypothetical protein MYP_2487 [Sporocytophaga myxococcoides]|uniref:Uncharacterized protein n=1 Tax=Sporocytophaga myxococcoides TaxID=153721 RepID=A0A098LGW6_9BACT|nr:hypothetical protein MYP_2487 [Sporocytophaga myxococcoides]